jgi:hypothetical protein
MFSASRRIGLKVEKRQVIEQAVIKHNQTHLDVMLLYPMKASARNCRRSFLHSTLI